MVFVEAHLSDLGICEAERRCASSALGHDPVLDVPIDAVLRSTDFHAAYAVAGDQEDGLIVQSHAEQILVLILDQSAERLILDIDIGRSTGGVDQSIQLRILRRVRIGGRTGAIAVIILMQGQRGVSSIADIPINSARTVGLVSGSRPQDGG